MIPVVKASQLSRPPVDGARERTLEKVDRFNEAAVNFRKLCSELSIDVEEMVNARIHHKLHFGSQKFMPEFISEIQVSRFGKRVERAVAVPR